VVIDDGGTIWLSNPWLVVVAISFAVALVLWCHRWLETGSAPAPRSLSVRTLRMAERRTNTTSGLAPAQLRPALRTRTTIGSLRGASGTRPSNAA
jgi:hypothetical protein